MYINNAFQSSSSSFSGTALRMSYPRLYRSYAWSESMHGLAHIDATQSRSRDSCPRSSVLLFENVTVHAEVRG